MKSIWSFIYHLQDPSPPPFRGVKLYLNSLKPPGGKPSLPLMVSLNRTQNMKATKKSASVPTWGGAPYGQGEG